MERSQFVAWLTEKIAGEMSGKKRWNLFRLAAEVLGSDKIEVFRSVEKVTKAKDAGTLLQVLDAAQA